MSQAGQTTVFWVRYEPAKALVTALVLSPEAELAHRRLTDHVWVTGRWPLAKAETTRGIARGLGAAWAQILAELSAVGWVVRRGLLYNAEVAAVLEEARRFRGQRINASALGVAARKGAVADSGPAGQPDNQPSGHPNGQLNGPPDGPPGGCTQKQNRTGTAHTALTDAERSTLIASAPKEKSMVDSAGVDSSINSPAINYQRSEKAFLAEVQDGIGLAGPAKAKSEADNWGGWWRNRFRENPDKARRVLAEVTSMLRERRIRKNPGACAYDLWKRLP